MYAFAGIATLLNDGAPLPSKRSGIMLTFLNKSTEELSDGTIIIVKSLHDEHYARVVGRVAPRQWGSCEHLIE